MNWGIVEWSALIGILTTILGSGLASYIAVIKSTINTRKDIESTQKDIDNGFNKLRNIEESTLNRITVLSNRIDKKAERLQTLESMLYEYLKKAEAETIYCKKETMQPIVDNVIKNQEMLYQDLKEFRNEVSGSISTIVKSLNEHITSDREFQQRLLDTILKGVNK
jgi:uncharacterized protein (UPF0305 family)